jgi:non-ribosomal peptide synthase protein (TIGR01720 family)
VLTDLLQVVLDTHDVLRSKLVGNDIPVLVVPEPGTVRATDVVTALAGRPTPDLLAEHRAAALAPTRGTMLRATWFESRPDERGWLLLVAHHLVVDGVSWRILSEDLAALWRAHHAGRRLELPRSSVSFQRWAVALTHQVTTRLDELSDWHKIVSQRDPLLGRRALDPAVDTAGSARGRILEIPTDLTVAVTTTVPRAFRTGATEVLLTGLAIAVDRWRGTSNEPVLLDVERHGREEGLLPGLGRTVGWFTNVHPVVLTPGGTANAALKRIKEQYAAVPSDGLGHGILRWLHDEAGPELARMPARQILFNYLGRFGTADGEFTPDGASALVAGADPDLPLAYPLEINVIAGVTGLRATFTWAPGVLRDDEVESLMTEWHDALRLLATAGPGGLTPSDLALVGLDLHRIEKLEADYPGVVDVLPVSPLQHENLRHTSRVPTGGDVYTLQLVFDLDGAVDTGRLRSAVQSLADRHAILRSAFVSDDTSDLLQVVLTRAAVPWQEVELPEDATEDWLTGDRAVRFDVSTPPLLRAALLRHSSRRQRLVLSAHHAVLDGWSLSLLYSELFQAYAGDDPIAAPVSSFADHLAWVAAQDDETAIRAWREQLTDVTPLLFAPVTAEDPTLIPARLAVEMSDVDTKAMLALARDRSLTPGVLVRTAWALALREFTGQSDVVFGTTVSGRSPDVVGMESMVGLHTGIIPTRAVIRSGDTFAGLAARLQDEQSATYSHQHVGWEAVARSLGHQELFAAHMVFHNYPIDPALLRWMGDIEVRSIDVRDGTHYPLSLVAWQSAGRLTLRIDYREDAYDLAAATEVSDLVVTMLDRLVRTPDDTV